MRWAFLLLLPVIWISSCGSTKPRERVSLEVDLPSAWQAVADSGRAIDSLWWQSFGSESLEAVLQEAFRKNYDLRIAAANLEAAAAQATISGSSLFPQVNASGSGSRRKQNFIGFPIANPGGGVPSSLSNTFGVSLSASWEIDLWGRLWKARSAGSASYRAAEADYQGARLSLAAQVCKSWFAAIEAHRQMELAQSTVDNYRVSHQQTERRYQSGLTTSLDARRSLSTLSASEATLSQRKAQYDVAIRQLEILLGRYPVATLAIADQLPELQGNIPAGLPAELIARRPDLLAAEQRVIAACASTSSARRALLPSISLTGSTGTSTNEVKNILNGDYSVWNIAGNLLQPLFQGGRLRANVKLAKSQEDIAEAGYFRAALRAFAEVESALAREGFLKEQEVALTTAAEQANASRDLAENQYHRGITTFLSLLDTQRSAYDTESRLLNTQLQRLNARIDLHLALGGGFIPTAPTSQSN